MNYSIDFEGGAQVSFPIKKSLTVDQVKGVLTDGGVANAEVQIVNGDTVSIRAESLGSAAGSDALRTNLAKLDPTHDQSRESVGATWGKEISNKAIRGLVIVLIAIALYVGLRFSLEMAIGAFVALIHDVTITAGFYALTGREVTPETVIAILTILGFSLYDTVVIYDKVQENTESTALVSRHGYSVVVNMSLNQVLMRSVNTSLVVLLPILSLLFFGGQTLKDFAFAMFIGVTTGAYSSIFIAAPILTIVKGREPEYRQLEARRSVRAGAATKAGSAAARVGDRAAASSSEQGAVAATTNAAASAAPARAATQRPKSRKKPPAKRKRR